MALLVQKIVGRKKSSKSVIGLSGWTYSGGTIFAASLNFLPSSSIVYLSIIPYSDNIVPSQSSLSGLPTLLKVHSPCIQRPIGSDFDICVFAREYTTKRVGIDLPR